MRRRIGLDFDNTIILYDRLFHELACDRGLIDKSVTINKMAVRDCIRSRPEGDLVWQELQAQAYGPEISRAVLAPGFSHFIQAGRASGHEFYIVSHKTAFSPMNPSGPDLRQASLGWMAKQHFFEAAGLGFRREDIFFEETRQKKIARIIALKCEIFIDDLIEVFREQTFPANVTKIYFADKSEPGASDLCLCRDWGEIQEQVLHG